MEKWQGAINDGFGWDFILLVNAIPLCGIVVEDTLQAAYDMAQYQLDNDYQFPVYCHLLVISDGNSMMVGDPWMELDKFTAIGTLKEALRPAPACAWRAQHCVSGAQLCAVAPYAHRRAAIGVVRIG